MGVSRSQVCIAPSHVALLARQTRCLKSPAYIRKLQRKRKRSMPIGFGNRLANSNYVMFQSPPMFFNLLLSQRVGGAPLGVSSCPRLSLASSVCYGFGSFDGLPPGRAQVIAVCSALVTTCRWSTLTQLRCSHRWCSSFPAGTGPRSVIHTTR